MASTIIPRFYVASGFWLWLLDRFGFDGITLPWGAIHMREAFFFDPWLREHELQHVRQIERLGRVRFCVRYVYEMVRYGYWQSPLEEEARHAERENGDRRALAMGYRVPVARAG